MLSPLFSPAGGGSSGSAYADPTDHRVPNDAPAGIPTNVPNDAANDAANGAANGAPSTKKQRRRRRQHWGAITYDGPTLHDGPYTIRRPL